METAAKTLDALERPFIANDEAREAGEEEYTLSKVC